ncbi:MAG: nuclear transport factor 2 family protein [Cyanobacteria bacterium J06636_16]
MEVIEYEKIVMPIDQYIQGALEGESIIMKQGFHPSAQIYGYLDGNLLADPMQVIYDYVDQHPPAGDLKYVIRSIDRSGNAASARVEIANWHGDTFTDFFTLLKIDNQWKITNKIFMQH